MKKEFKQRLFPKISVYMHVLLLAEWFLQIFLAAEFRLFYKKKKKKKKKERKKEKIRKFYFALNVPVVQSFLKPIIRYPFTS